MQGNRTKWRKLILELIPAIVLIALVVIDQITKLHVKWLAESTTWTKTVVIPNFFEFRFTMNSGAAFSFLANVSWGQLFFKILTPVALILFGVFYFYLYKKGYKWAKYAMAFIVAGTIGNFIDRLAYDSVIDFISLIFGDYYFPIFNLADTFMTVGIIMILVHFCFLDENALFKKKKKEIKSDEEVQDGNNGK